MPIIATLELRFRPELLDEAREVLGRALTQTRSFDGNLGVEVLINENDPAHWIAHETWESIEHDTAYREFRAGAGALPDLPLLLAERPVLTWFRVDGAI